MTSFLRGNSEQLLLHPRLQPADAALQPLLLEDHLELITELCKMPPRLEMHRDQYLRSNLPEELCCLCPIHRNLQLFFRKRHTGSAKVHQCNHDVPLLPQAASSLLNVDRVPGEVNSVRLPVETFPEFLALDDETRALAAGQVDARGPGDAEVTAAGAKVDGLPRGQTDYPRAGREFRGAVERGEDAASVEEPAT